jgi:hypothetical protein
MMRIMSFHRVESVEKLSTFPVDKCNFDMSVIMSLMKCVDNVEKLSTLVVDK